MSCGNSHYFQPSLSWGLLPLILSGGPWPQVISSLACTDQNSPENSREILSRFPEFSFCAALSSLVLCAANSSHFGFTGSQLYLIKRGTPPGSSCGPHGCAEAWKFSQGSKLESSQNSPCLFPLTQNSCPLLPVLHWQMSSVFKNIVSYILSIFYCFQPVSNF